MPSPDTLIAFLGIALIITFAPGPDNLMVLGQSLARGRMAGFGIAVGCALGCFTHVLWATLGVSAALAASPMAFTALKLAGAAYLAWLGIQAIRSGGQLAVNAQAAPARPWRKDVGRGFVANAINPKVGLFFLAFMPQFVHADAGSATLQMLVLGLVFMLQTVVVFGAVAYMAGGIGRLLKRRPGVAPWLDRIAGVIFLGLALRLVLDDTQGLNRMRRHPQGALPEPATGERHDLTTIKTLFPYLWSYKGRVFLALACLLGAKVANVGVPMVFKHMVDAMTITTQQAFIIVPAALIVAYGVLRFMTSMLTELRELIFARVTQQAVRNISLQVFRHLHALSLRFHLERQTGGLTRDIERGTRSIGSLISYTLYSILPTLVEVGLVIGILYVNYDPIFSVITTIALTLYITFTVKITNWRTALRRKANELDSAANARAIDSLLNFETVKYFNNEEFEARRYDEQMRQWADAQIKNQLSLSGLNIGQAAIIAIAVTSMLWQASIRVVDGSMTIGDIVLVNAYMLQLYIPLNFLGVIYREIRQALTDIERMFGLLNQPREIADKPDAGSLAADNATVRFEKVSFAYDPARQILFDVDFEIPAGKTVAVVGHSGSGKSTLGRLLFRFYDVTGGRITVNGTDIRDLQQDSLRQAIGIVPQDTVLFNDTLRYNIQYGRPDAADGLIDTAAAAAQLTDFIGRLPDGYEARVGERGLKLSGGEKQRVAIARALLKDPAILIFDEATSALDSRTEKAIQAQIDLAARGRTALIIAHRLSTIAHADEILVLDQGHIVERGRHQALLAANGAYAQMWRLQQQEASEADSAT